jgi:hypothetical protein
MLSLLRESAQYNKYPSNVANLCLWTRRTNAAFVASDSFDVTLHWTYTEFFDYLTY